MFKENSTDWDQIIDSNNSILDFRLKEIWKYNYLIYMFVRRDFTTFYRQTILGPLWYFIQPLLTTTLFTIVFSYIARISTNGIPPHLFYLSGLIPWAYFSSSLVKTSNTFLENSAIFGKVYFPRIIVPISVVIINLIQFTIQFIIFIVFYIYQLNIENSIITPSIWILYIPICLLQLMILSMGFGILVSSFTTKYRDLLFLIQFGVQLWMYISPIVYPASLIPEKYLNYYMINPIAPIIEMFRIAFFNIGVFNFNYIIISWLLTFLVFIIGILSFHKVEKSFMDTI